MRTLLSAFVFVSPVPLVGVLASPIQAGLVWLCGGLLMVILSARGRPWTAWASAPDWPGMTDDTLFVRINQALLTLWGGVFALGAGAAGRPDLGAVGALVVPPCPGQTPAGRRP